MPCARVVGGYTCTQELPGAEAEDTEQPGYIFRDKKKIAPGPGTKWDNKTHPEIPFSHGDKSIGYPAGAFRLMPASVRMPCYFPPKSEQKKRTTLETPTRRLRQILFKATHSL